MRLVWTLGGDSMYIECFTNNGKPYLRLVRSVRIIKPDGRKVTQKQPVFNIGPLDHFDDGKPDYVERLKRSYREGKPLIDSLLPLGRHLLRFTPFKLLPGASIAMQHPSALRLAFLILPLRPWELTNVWPVSSMPRNSGMICRGSYDC